MVPGRCQKDVTRWCPLILVDSLGQGHYKQACFAGCTHTLPNASLPIGNQSSHLGIHKQTNASLFNKIAVTVEPMMQFGCPLEI